MQKRTRSEKASGFLKRYPLCFAALTSRLSAGVGIGANLVRDAERKGDDRDAERNSEYNEKRNSEYNEKRNSEHNEKNTFVW